TNNGSTKDVQPPVVQTESPILNSMPVVAPIIEPVVAHNVYAVGAYQRNSYQPQGNRNLLGYRSDDYLGAPGEQSRKKPILPGSFTWSKPNSSLSSTSLSSSGLPSSSSSTIDSSIVRKLSQVTQLPTRRRIRKGITTRSGTTYQGPTIPTTSSSLPPVVERKTEATKDTVHPTNNGSTEDVKPPVVPTESLILNSEPVVSPILEPVTSPVSDLKPNQRPSIPYPSRLQDQKLPLADLGASINLMPLSVWNKLSLPDLSPTCMTLELADRLISRPVGVAENVFVKVGTFHFPADFVVVDFDVDPRVPLILRRSFLKTGRALIDLFKEAFLNDDPSLPPPNQENYLPEVRKELKIREAKYDKSSIDEPPEVELKDLPPHLEYVFLEGDDKLLVIIAKYLIFGNSFQTCLSYLEKMLKRCEDTNLCLNWEKSHFMVKEGIVLDHKIFKEGIEVDKSKVDVIAKLPHPTTVMGIRSFLGHAGFYLRFIKDFSKIARSMTRLLEKDTIFLFSKECVEAFQTLKRKSTEAPILIAPD
nr:reverse transcriptase domain-containing protein [Tanacetum cinerariifolium]